MVQISKTWREFFSKINKRHVSSIRQYRVLVELEFLKPAQNTAFNSTYTYNAVLVHKSQGPQIQPEIILKALKTYQT